MKGWTGDCGAIMGGAGRSGCPPPPISWFMDGCGVFGLLLSVRLSRLMSTPFRPDHVEPCGRARYVKSRCRSTAAGKTTLHRHCTEVVQWCIWLNQADAGQSYWEVIKYSALVVTRLAPGATRTKFWP